MTPQRSALSSFFWLFLLFLFGAVVTAAVFCVFVPGPDRGMTFYIAMSLVIAAEFLVFIHLANPGTRAGGESSSPATRYMAQGGIFIWFILTVIIAAFAVNPKWADTITADRILIIDLILTFLLFAFLYAIYSKDLGVKRIDQRLVEERTEIQIDVPALEAVMRFINDLGRQHAEYLGLSDRVGKKVDTVRSAIEAVVVSERNPSGDWTAEIKSQIDNLTRLSSGQDLSSDDARERLDKISEQVDTLLIMLKRRERSLTS